MALYGSQGCATEGGRYTVSLYRNPPKTQYVDTGAGWVGYQVFGEGSVNLLFVGMPDSNIELMWEQRQVARYFDRLATFARVAFYDGRGSGVSDPVIGGGLSTYDSALEDARAVMDVAGFDSAVVVGDREAGPGAMAFAASYPGRTDALVLVNTFARALREEGYDIGMPIEALDHLRDLLRSLWGTPGFYLATAPSLKDDPVLCDWLARYQRLSSGPSTIDTLYALLTQVDVRSVLPAIHAATLVITRRDATFHRPAFGEYIAGSIADAAHVSLPGANTSPFWVGDVDPVLDAIEEFITGNKSRPVSDRMFATVLFTDIVDSTRLAADVGDEAWLDMLEEHGRITGTLVDRHRGALVKNTGDGIVATFDGPSRGLSCAIELSRSLAHAGLPIRAGLHTGEIEVQSDGDIAGIAVHIAARVMAELIGDGVLVSNTVKELIVGSDIEVEPIGERELKGVPGRWGLYRVAPELGG